MLREGIKLVDEQMMPQRRDAPYQGEAFLRGSLVVTLCGVQLLQPMPGVSFAVLVFLKEGRTDLAWRCVGVDVESTHRIWNREDWHRAHLLNKRFEGCGLLLGEVDSMPRALSLGALGQGLQKFV